MPGYWGKYLPCATYQVACIMHKSGAHSVWNADAVSWTLSCLLRLPDSRCKYLASVADQMAWVVYLKASKLKRNFLGQQRYLRLGFSLPTWAPAKSAKSAKDAKSEFLTLSVAVKCFKRTRHAPSSGPWVILLGTTGLDVDFGFFLALTCSKLLGLSGNSWTWKWDKMASLSFSDLIKKWWPVIGSGKEEYEESVLDTWSMLQAD